MGSSERLINKFFPKNETQEAATSSSAFFKEEVHLRTTHRFNALAA